MIKISVNWCGMLTRIYCYMKKKAKYKWISITVKVKESSKEYSRAEREKAWGMKKLGRGPSPGMTFSLIEGEVVGRDSQWMLKISGLPRPELPHIPQTSRKYPLRHRQAGGWQGGLPARAWKPKALPWGTSRQACRQAQKELGLWKPAPQQSSKRPRVCDTMLQGHSELVPGARLWAQ